MEIRSNGSKLAGEEPNSVEKLIQVLGEETLDAGFERYGNFVHRYGDTTHLFGNFLTRSHVFNIRGALGELWPIIEAITENQNTKKYIEERGNLSGWYR